MSKGYMRISRDKLESWCWRGNMYKNYLMMYLLVKANFKSEPFEKIMVERGQYVFSYDGLSRETGMPLQTLRTTLKDLEKTKQITIKPTRRWSLLTICEYDSWQVGCNETNTQPVTQSVTQSDTKIISKEVEEIKEEGTKVPKKKDFSPPTYDEVDAYIREKGFHFDAKDFIDYYEADDWHYGTGTKRKKVESWKRCCLTWEKQRRPEETDMFSQQEEEEHRPKVLVINGVTYR